MQLLLVTGRVYESKCSKAASGSQCAGCPTVVTQRCAEHQPLCSPTAQQAVSTLTRTRGKSAISIYTFRVVPYGSPLQHMLRQLEHLGVSPAKNMRSKTHTIFSHVIPIVAATAVAHLPQHAVNAVNRTPVVGTSNHHRDAFARSHPAPLRQFCVTNTVHT